MRAPACSASELSIKRFGEAKMMCPVKSVASVYLVVFLKMSIYRRKIHVSLAGQAAGLCAKELQLAVLICDNNISIAFD